MTKLVKMKMERNPEWQTPHPDLQLRANAVKVKSLEDAFKIFQVIQEISDTEEAAYIACKDVISEFAADNVKYLELRTTPRSVPETGMTKRSYLESVLRAISECRCDLDIEVRLLVAIDRRTTVKDAMDTVELAIDLMRENSMVVGLDLSGNPVVNDARDFLPVLKKAKSAGLRLALHLAEVAGSTQETLALLELPPDRLGHGTFLDKDANSEDMIKLVNKYKIPIEICPTSNLITSVARPEDLHFQYWYDRKHPIVICTDDKGVFSCSLSEEFALIAEAFKLSEQQLYHLSYQAIDYIFAGDDIKKKLSSEWTAFHSASKK